MHLAPQDQKRQLGVVLFAPYIDARVGVLARRQGGLTIDEGIDVDLGTIELPIAPAALELVERFFLLLQLVGVVELLSAALVLGRRLHVLERMNEGLVTVLL